MIPTNGAYEESAGSVACCALLALLWGLTVSAGEPAGLHEAPSKTGGVAVSCLESGDGYLKTRLGGAIEARIDWPNSGTRCEGEERPGKDGIRLSFSRASGAAPDLLFVFGISGVREGQSAKGAGVNLTIIEQGTSRIFGTQGVNRCTVDSLLQRRLDDPATDSRKAAPAKARAAGRRYRVEARGFCVQPAHAVRGDGSVLASTFDFAGLVRYDAQEALK